MQAYGLVVPSHVLFNDAIVAAISVSTYLKEPN
jgi:hypothetical protein